MRKNANNQIFTPPHIVNFMLDNVGLMDEKLLVIKFMEPSFGDGAFLIPMVTRILDYARFMNLSDEEIVQVLLTNVHGIEKDANLYEKAVYNLNYLLNTYNIASIDWSKNLIQGNTLVKSRKLKNKFDLVIGNPPYTRVHALDKRTKNVCSTYAFGKGMKDLYVVFYEAGINMLNDNGTLCYITPNSFMYNSSQKEFRQHLIDKRLLFSICDFKSKKVFDNVGTYTCICTLTKQEHNDLLYFDSTDTLPGSVTLLQFDDIKEPAEAWCFNDIDRSLTNAKISDDFNVQYGIATNADKVFIGKAYLDREETKPVLDLLSAPNLVYFNKMPIESAILKHAVKASTYNGFTDNTYIIFPYQYKENTCTLITEKELMLQYPAAFRYLYKNRKVLHKRDTKEKWYAFGRTQGLLNMNKEKLVIKHVMPNNNELIKAFIVSQDTVVYSGIFITTTNNKPLAVCQEILQSINFKKYCSMVGKPMSNNYLSINSKIIKSYSY